MSYNSKTCDGPQTTSLMSILLTPLIRKGQRILPSFSRTGPGGLCCMFTLVPPEPWAKWPSQPESKGTASKSQSIHLCVWNNNFYNLLSILSPSLLESSPPPPEASRGLCPPGTCPHGFLPVYHSARPCPAGSSSAMPNQGHGHLFARLPRTGIRDANTYRKRVRRAREWSKQSAC